MPAKKPLKLTDHERALMAYVDLGAKHGCPPDQILNFFNAGMLLQPKQLEMAAAARVCDIKGKASSLGVGGARAGGKSAWMFAQICLDDCQRFPGLKVLFLRKSATSAREQIRDLLLKTCKNVKYNYREQAGLIEFENGSFIIIKHFKDSKDIENFLGQEYDVVAIEELTTLTFDKWKNLMTCLRTSKQNWRPRFYGAWNWGGIGHAWVKRVFHDPWKDGTQSDTIYIKATVRDNRHVNDENKKILETLTGWKYKSWYLGDPDFQAGQFFTNWSEGVHIYPNSFYSAAEKDFVAWFCSFDHGFAHPCCCHLHGRLRNGDICTVDEYHQHESVPSENAENILAMLRRHGLRPDNLEFFVAGNDCFSRRISETDAKTIATMYGGYGIDMTPAVTDRINRWEIMGNRLGNTEKGTAPTWHIHQRCVHLIEQIPLAQHHETRTGDIAKMNAEAETGEGGDDALECLAGDTLVMTEFGEVPILEIKAGVRVWTRRGLQRVTYSSMTAPAAKVYKVKLSNGLEITGTGNHPVWTDENGWQRLDSLHYGIIVTICEAKLSSSMESNSGVIPTRPGGTCKNTTGPAATTGSVALARCIRRSGEAFMDHIRQPMRFITRMKTRSTMTFQISNASPHSSTGENTQCLAIPMWSRTSTESGIWRQHGTAPEWQGQSPKKTGPKHLAVCLWKKLTTAIFAVVCFRSKHQTIAQSSALENAPKPNAEKTGWTASQENARSAGAILKPTNIALQKPARVRVVRFCEAGFVPVYNLTVENCPEYFAGGILVHNCASFGLASASSGIDYINSLSLTGYQPITLSLGQA